MKRELRPAPLKFYKQEVGCKTRLSCKYIPSFMKTNNNNKKSPMAQILKIRAKGGSKSHENLFPGLDS